jgi:chromate transporter
MLTLLLLCTCFGSLSLLAFGGGSAMLPEMARMCLAHGWTNAEEFTLLYNLGQLAPGPNMMMVLTVGHKVAGLPGALAVMVGFFLPPAMLAFALGRAYNRLRSTPYEEAFRRVMAPVSLGLALAGVHLMASSALTQVGSFVIFGLALWALQKTNWHPFFLVLAGGLVGALAF